MLFKIKSSMNNILFIQPYDFPAISAGKNRKSVYIGKVAFEVGYQIPSKYGFYFLDLNLEIHRGKTVGKAVREKISECKPEIIFITFPTFAQGKQVEAIIKAIRKVSDCKIVIGGAAISLIGNAPLKWWEKYNLSGCYSGFGTEIPEIIEYFLEENTKLTAPSGFYNSKESKSVQKGRSLLVDNYDPEIFFSIKGRFDFPDYLDSFRNFDLSIIGIIEMMRGCKCSCDFCAINSKRLGCYFRSSETVANEAMFLAKHGVKYIHIIDPTFGLDKKRTHTLLEKLANIHARFKTNFEVVTRADIISNSFVQAMKKAGVSRCDIGMETMSSEQLEKVKKNLNPHITIKAIELLSQAEIQTKLFHIVFPGRISTETLGFLAELSQRKIDFIIQSSYLRELPTPNSPPHFIEQDQRVFDPEKDSIEQLMEYTLVNLCFKSMDTQYRETEELTVIIEKYLKNNLPLENLFKYTGIKNNFRLDFIPKLNGNSYAYLHKKGIPFSLGMCKYT